MMSYLFLNHLLINAFSYISSLCIRYIIVKHVFHRNGDLTKVYRRDEGTDIKEDMLQGRTKT